MNLPEYSAEMRRLSRSLDESLTELRRAGIEYAERDAAYRQAWALAFLNAVARTVREREALADAETNKDRLQRNLADAVRTGATEAVRSRRTQISALQSELAAYKAEAEFARTGPEGH